MRIYTKHTVILIAVVLYSCLSLEFSAAVTIDWVYVGNPKNAPDAKTGSRYGAVDYEYVIGKYEVTINQYCEFLNAVDPDGKNELELWVSEMSTDTDIVGIDRDENAQRAEKYRVLGDGDRPITYVSWNSAVRFVNWLQNSQAGGDTEFGVYDLTDKHPHRAEGSRYFLPTENEWYKAAYYNPSSREYWEYPTGSNDPPDSHDANYNRSFFKNEGGSKLSPVGFYKMPSKYGTFDQGGNVIEWNETAIFDNKGVRAGSWKNDFDLMASKSRYDVAPTLSSSSVGFRVAGSKELFQMN